VSGLPGSVSFLLDQGIARDAARILRSAGVTCEHVGEIGFSRAEDSEILALARKQGAAVVTLDSDFHTILAVSNETSPSVIRLRLQGLNGEKVAMIVANLARWYQSELSQGCMLTVKVRKTTCRMLPVSDR
jgi:predicted nuclease of predicted toxin-antitoxin system